MDWSKEIDLPHFLHDLHGERTTPASLLMVYLGASIVALFVALVASGIDLVIWKRLLLFVVFFDIGGGAVANFTRSTTRYYRGSGRKRTIFLLMHFLHPALLFLIFPTAAGFFLSVSVYTIVSAMVLEGLKPHTEILPAASLLMLPGLMISFLIPLPHEILYAFAPLFMLKLLIGFSGQRQLVE